MKYPVQYDLRGYSAVVVNISGGKDSQTILGLVMRLAREQAYSGQIIAVHADTGAEWPQSLPHCELLCRHYQVPLQVAHPFRALPDHIERRCHMLAQQSPPKPGWPTMAQRYCTSDCKRSPIEKVMRRVFPHGLEGEILSVTGERREESPRRSRMQVLEPDKRLTAGNRTVTRWKPILDYRLEDVWQHIKATGLPRHPAYDLGNERVSCAICMLATDADIRRGATAVPRLADHYLRLERETGFTMKQGKSLKQILQPNMKPCQ